MARIRSGRPAKSSTAPVKPKSKPRSASKRAAASASTIANAYSYDAKPSGRAHARAKVDEAQANAAKGKGKARAVEQDDDEEEEWAGFKMGGASDEEIDFADNDEDIDSDEADTDGEDAPVEPAVSQSKKRPANGNIDLDEESAAEDDDDDDDEGFDISEMLDRPDDAADSDDSDEVDEVETGSEAGLDKLDAFVSSLPANSKRDEADGDADAPRKRRRLQERTEASNENEFAAIGVRDQGKLRLEDLLSTLPAAQRAQLKKTLKPLAASEPADPDSAARNPLKAAGPLPAPLPHLYQAKIDRQAANEVLGKELEGWNDTLRTMKGIGKVGQEFGGNRLSLPLGAPTGPSSQLNGADVLAKFTATTDLERSVQSILSAAHLTPRALNAAETAALAALPPAEAASRVAEVRRQRELLFRAERKAKRVGKIKSKTYHRLQKKARQRAAAEGEDGLTIEELGQLDEADGGDRAREMRERLETRRARERATLRHAPGASKWSQAMKGVDGLDEHGRAALQERADRAEDLRRKVLGKDDVANSDASDEDHFDVDDADDDAIRANAFDELTALERREADEAAQGKPGGLAGMKFMVRAAAVEKQRADELAADLRRDLEGRPDEDDEDVADDAAPASNRVEGNVGRLAFAPSLKQAAQEATEKPKKTKREHKVKTSGPVDLPAPVSSQPLPNPFASLSSFSTEAAPSNPWLSLGDPDAAKKLSRKRDDASKPTAADKVAAKAEKRKKRSEEGRRAAADEAKVVIEPDAALAIDEVDGELVEDEPVHVDRRRTAFSQQDLVARAFANDDVVAEFEEEKRKETEADAPFEVDDTIPGWGSWGGKGAPRSKRAPLVRQVPGIDAASRQDAKLKHVIISERRDKKSTKYLVKDLPFPYTSAAQREQALRQPLGPEWATATTMKIARKPDVIHRPGVLISPVTKEVA